MKKPLPVPSHAAYAGHAGHSGLVVLLLMLAFGLAACSTPAVKTVTLTYPATLTDSQVQSAITQAATLRKWTIRSVNQGRVELAYKEFPSTVTYGGGNIVITDSGQHRKTAAWAQNLCLSIRNEITRLTR
ncbi:MAG: hypothetical protein LBK99_19995 [Opitutaceae bacterium]|jgi:ABC-type glycerol-3-phosphate transport system substrate-binding protein|nr:hypothetical protein [Opitutaceae bacterium]